MNTRSKWKLAFGAAGFLAALGAFPNGTSRAADHHDGPATKGDPAADITDLFTFPVTSDSGRKRLVLIMTVHAFAGKKAQFSDQVEYIFRVRRADVQGTGNDVDIKTREETRIACRFKKQESSDRMRATCRAKGPACDGECPTAHVETGDESGGDETDLRVFAGRRADPFFSDVARVRLPHTRDFEVDVPGINTFGLTNVLGLVVEVDVKRVLGGTKDGSTFAVVAQTKRAGGAK
jgi:hypothetical protein